MLATVAVLHRG